MGLDENQARLGQPGRGKGERHRPGGGWSDGARHDDDRSDWGDDALSEDTDRPARGSSPRSRTLVADETEYEPGELQGMVDLYEETMRDIEEGEIVRGKVLHVGDKEVLVDVGFKSEGAIPLSEFTDPSSVKVGDEIDVFLERMENQDGLVVLSKKRADFLRVWNLIKEAYDEGKSVRGKVVRRIKGGLVVDLFGVDAFLPGSQVALRQVANLEEVLGQVMDFKVIKLNKRRRNIVVSRRVVLEEERARQKEQLVTTLEKGQVREGIVKNITDFGAFVDLGGIDGLLHVTDIAWGRVSHPSEALSIGQKVQVKVLEYDPERERISLGLKQLTPYPWDAVEQKYPVGSSVRGRVVSITDYGAFVELEKGVEGLVHVSEMSWTRHVRHPSKVVTVGQEVEAMVLKVDRENEKISLGLKQVEPDPWSTLDQKYPRGTRLVGKVRNLTNFGAFVEIEDGIDGLVHVSDLSWTRRVKHPSEVLKKGDKVDVMVLGVDKEKRRISLGIKQVQENPWEALAERFQPGTEARGSILRVLDRGVVVDLGSDVEGFVPVSQLGKEGLKKPADFFQPGDEIPLKVIRVDLPNRRIVLSVDAYMADQDAQVVEEFNARYGGHASQVSEHVGEAAGGTAPEWETEGETSAREEEGEEELPA